MTSTETEVTDMTLTHDGIEPVIPGHTHKVCDRCAAYEAAIDVMTAKIDEQVRLLNVVVENVKPTLDAISASPIGRMFGMETR